MSQPNTSEIFLSSQKPSEESLLNALVKTCKDLGWDIGIPKINNAEENQNDSEDEISGLIIGTNDFVTSIMDKI